MDLEFTRGDTKKFKFRLRDKNKQPIELAPTDKLYLTAKKDPNSNAIIFQKTIGNGIELKEDGYYHVTINPDDTNQLPYGTYGYDVQITTVTGKTKTFIVSTITLTEEYTHKGDEI